MVPGERFLGFRCTGCGNCCKEPLLPLTDDDVLRIKRRTGDDPRTFIDWIDRHGIDMDNEPEAFVRLAEGRRVMVLRHTGGACKYLGSDDRCTIYSHRPLGCRVFPFDPTFARDGKLRRLKLIQAATCVHELDGDNDPMQIRRLHQRHTAATQSYQAKIAAWNREQTQRRRRGAPLRSSKDFLEYLGVL